MLVCCHPSMVPKRRDHFLLLIKIQPDATVCRYLFTAKSLYMFQVSQHESSRLLKTVTAASGTGHNISTGTSLQQLLSSSVARLGQSQSGHTEGK